MRLALALARLALATRYLVRSVTSIAEINYLRGAAVARGVAAVGVLRGLNVLCIVESVSADFEELNIAEWYSR